ncbi:low molecular weight phosphatase family protein [Ornithinimicrobium sp. F0845]|uniref:arsenate reductase/protein-tyrosine-phosphatase family protein n=1 Tax=Ornithinimicrobium sp. F0845 TaxID=2926412 RepID=UPI001FF39F89|nr:low molecular weight phosphatase family protein [Ornithinimicrobium sp. F0845]MCK0112301.1 low molecular weight phosphatase family protein [Ornithinimicrobium sp. F0845]
MSDLSMSDPSPDTGARPARLLTVCTGNVCRSPLLERVLQRRLDQRWGTGRYEVSSAGTHALVGQAMDERSADLLQSFGGSPDGFVARRLTARLIADADLVLVATTAHRGLVIREHPPALRHTFTFRELGALTDTLTADPVVAGDLPPAERLRALAATLIGRRGPGVVREPDIVDPYRRDDRVYRQMAEEIRGALPSVFRALG